MNLTRIAREAADAVFRNDHDRPGFFVVEACDPKRLPRRPTRITLDHCRARSLLVLGYEPTRVVSEIRVSNGAATTGARVVFDPRSYQILVLNNGTSSPGPDAAGMVGVFHSAKVNAAAEGTARIVNSICLGAAPEQQDVGAFFDLA
ncbi:MAG: hypothetical protein ACI9WU_003129 [Myxococcota bacterium]|jgi:hypothetical protein